MDNEINRLYSNLGSVIQKYRQRVNMSKKELAEGICNNSYITLIEKGHRCPNAVIMFKLCERLGISPNLLYQCLFFNDIEPYLENEVMIFACLRRMDYLNANHYAHLNENHMPSFISRKEIPQIGDIFADGLRNENFAEQLEKLLNLNPRIETLFIKNKSTTKEIPLLRQYDIYSISDYVLLHIFSGKSDIIYSKLKKHISLLEHMIFTDINAHQMFLFLKFEIALICNDLKRYKEAILYIDDALNTAKKYTLGAVIPYLMYARGECFWLRNQKEIGREYLKRAFEFHKAFAPENDNFIAVRIRMKQKGICVD